MTLVNSTRQCVVIKIIYVIVFSTINSLISASRKHLEHDYLLIIMILYRCK